MRLGYDDGMTAEAKRVLHAALQLSIEDREEIIDVLEESLEDASSEDSENAWIEEVRRRVADVESGKATLVSSESTRQMRTEILERARARRAG